MSEHEHSLSYFNSGYICHRAGQVSPLRLCELSTSSLHIVEAILSTIYTILELSELSHNSQRFMFIFLVCWHIHFAPALTPRTEVVIA